MPPEDVVREECTAGYSAAMTVWQYAQLRVTYDNRSEAGGRWTMAWHGPDATTQDTAGVYGDVVAELNRAGTAGWELVDVTTLAAGDSSHFSDETNWSLTRYTFMRPYDPMAAENPGLIQRADSPRSQPTRTGQPEHPLDDNLAGSMTAESAVVRLTGYWLPDRSRRWYHLRARGRSASGRLLVKREAARVSSQADIDAIESFRSRHEKPHVSTGQREKIKAAAADYAASRVEGQFGVTWGRRRRAFRPPRQPTC